MAKDVLLLSKEKNDSNEVAITCDLGGDNPLDNFGVALGTEHEVDILADTLSNHIIVSGASVAIVVLHNHPSARAFSLQDIRFFYYASDDRSDRGSIKSGDSTLSEKGFGIRL